MRSCLYYTEFGCLRSKECNCDKKIKGYNSSYDFAHSRKVGESFMEDSLHKGETEILSDKEFSEKILNNIPSPHQFKNIK